MEAGKVRAIACAVVLLALAAFATYRERLSGPLLFDDQSAIIDNQTLRARDLTTWLSPPDGTPVAARPLANLSFVLNYRWHSLSSRAFHVTNLALHALCCLMAFAALRRLLRATELCMHADALALATALLFCVHPMAAELVLYATQRTEALAALCYLTATWVLARDAQRGTRSWPWLLLVSTLGVASKEVFVTAPLVLLCCDRAFFAGSFRAALRARKHDYLALCAPLALAVWLQRSHPRQSSVRFLELDYLLAQARVVPRYFLDALWPAEPMLDYGPLWPQSMAAGLLGAGIAVLAAAAFFAWRWPKLGFALVWICGVLAPSSSLVSIHTEVGATRRFYLPLLALLACAVASVAALLLRAAMRPRLRAAVGGGVAVFAIALLVTQTRAYASHYRSTRAYWEATLAAAPDNVRARYNLALLSLRSGEQDAAVAHLQAALASHEAFADAHASLANLLLARGQLAEGLEHAARNATLSEHSASAHYAYASALERAGRVADAARELEKTLALAPKFLDAQRRLSEAHRLLAGGEPSVDRN